MSSVAQEPPAGFDASGLEEYARSALARTMAQVEEVDQPAPSSAQEPTDPMSDERLEKIRNWNAPGTVETYQILDLLAEVDRLRTENAELDRINQQVHTLNRKLVARAVDAERTQESS